MSELDPTPNGLDARARPATPVAGVLPNVRVRVQRSSIFPWLLLAGLGACLAAITLSAAVLRVPEDYPTVRAAYAAAADGDTIQISTNLSLEAPGEFLPSKSVTLATAGTRTILAPNTPPANDSFTNRLALTGAVLTATADNYAATTEPGEPTPHYGTVPRRSLWWSWTAPTNGLVVINTVGSEFVALVDVYLGATFPPVRFPTNQLDAQLQNEVAFYVQLGETYQIAVNAPHPDAFGRVVLNIVMPDPPDNDNFADRFPLLGVSPKITGYTYTARREAPAEPNHAGRAAGRSVWYSWTAPTNGPSRPVAISTFGSDFDTVLAVYVGSDLTQLTAVGSNDDIDFGITASRVTFVPAPGATYQIAVDGSTKNGSNPSRERYGNLILSVDYSLLNLTVGLVQSTVVTQKSTVEFRADLRVQNPSSASAGPLRLRLFAASGYSPAATHLAGPAFLSDLATTDLTPAVLGPSSDQFLSVQGVCPAPVFDPQFGGYRGWAVFAVVEEQLGPRWVPLDGVFLLYGLFAPLTGPGAKGLSGPEAKGLSLGVPLRGRTPLPVINGEQIFLEFLVVRTPPLLAEASVQPVEIYARLSDDSEVLVAPDELVWTLAPGIVVATNLAQTNSLLTVSAFARRTTVTNRCDFSFGGDGFTTWLIFTVVPRPWLQASYGRTNRQVQLLLLGEPGRAYVLEAASRLARKDHSGSKETAKHASDRL